MKTRGCIKRLCRIGTDSWRTANWICERFWSGEEYNSRGEKQLVRYLDDYHQNKGYMVSFNFNRKKQPGVQEMVIDGKQLIEAVV